MNICKLLKYLQVAEIFASCCALQVSEATLVKTEGLADEALRWGEPPNQMQALLTPCKRASNIILPL
jgi:hypothetical protein